MKSSLQLEIATPFMAEKVERLNVDLSWILNRRAQLNSK